MSWEAEAAHEHVIPTFKLVSRPMNWMVQEEYHAPDPKKLRMTYCTHVKHEDTSRFARDRSHLHANTEKGCSWADGVSSHIAAPSDTSAATLESNSGNEDDWLQEPAEVSSLSRRTSNIEAVSPTFLLRELRDQQEHFHRGWIEAWAKFEQSLEKMLQNDSNHHHHHPSVALSLAIRGSNDPLRHHRTKTPMSDILSLSVERFTLATLRQVDGGGNSTKEKDVQTSPGPISSTRLDMFSGVKADVSEDADILIELLHKSIHIYRIAAQRYTK